MSKHSPEPWKMEPYTGPAENWCMHSVTCNGQEKFVCAVSGSTSGQSFANAARIVACVNACAGIPSDRLDKIGKMTRISEICPIDPKDVTEGLIREHVNLTFGRDIAVTFLDECPQPDPVNCEIPPPTGWTATIDDGFGGQTVIENVEFPPGAVTAQLTEEEDQRLRSTFGISARLIASERERIRKEMEPERTLADDILDVIRKILSGMRRPQDPQKYATPSSSHLRYMVIEVLAMLEDALAGETVQITEPEHTS